jgi:hypothetical protein
MSPHLMRMSLFCRNSYRAFATNEIAQANTRKNADSSNTLLRFDTVGTVNISKEDILFGWIKTSQKIFFSVLQVIGGQVNLKSAIGGENLVRCLGHLIRIVTGTGDSHRDRRRIPPGTWSPNLKCVWFCVETTHTPPCRAGPGPGEPTRRPARTRAVPP